MNANRYAKAVTGALVAALSAYAVAQVDNHISQQEWVTVAIAFLTGLGLVWGVPNSPAPEPAQPAPPVVIKPAEPVDVERI